MRQGALLSLRFKHFTEKNNPKFTAVPASLWAIWEWVATAVVLIKRWKSPISLSAKKFLFHCQPKMKNSRGK